MDRKRMLKPLFYTLLISICFPQLLYLPLPAQSPSSLKLNGQTQYLQLGQQHHFQPAKFSLELWFQKLPGGEFMHTGGDGLRAIPLICKGRDLSSNSASKFSYLLGIGTEGVLVGDFAEDLSSFHPGQHHPIQGTTRLQDSTWYHAALTYNGEYLSLYLNAQLEQRIPVTGKSNVRSHQVTAVGSSLLQGQPAAGFFHGHIDEVRIWRYARKEWELKDNLHAEMTYMSGLSGYWPCNEGQGSQSSVFPTENLPSWHPQHAQLIGQPTWVSTQTGNFPENNLPLILNPLPDAKNDCFQTNKNIHIALQNVNRENLRVTLYGRKKETTPPKKFTIIGLPDTQTYVADLHGANNEMFKAQTRWIAENRDSLNIIFVAHLGDCVENGDNNGDPVEWRKADSAMRKLEVPAGTTYPDGIPYGIAVGNHDQTVAGTPGNAVFYNLFFGEERFRGRDYYGGHHGLDNNNHFQLFASGAYKFIAISFEFDHHPPEKILDWADSLLTAYPDRRALLYTHYMVEHHGRYSPQGGLIYNRLKHHPNLFLLLGGHFPVPEARRTDFLGTHRVHALLSDFQAEAGGGNGFLRIMEFEPATNRIQVRTYSPYLDSTLTHRESQFSLPYEMDFHPISSLHQVKMKTAVRLPWSGLEPNAEYEWFVRLSDGQAHYTSERYSFTTPSLPVKTIPLRIGKNEQIRVDGSRTLKQLSPDAQTLLSGFGSHTVYRYDQENCLHQDVYLLQPGPTPDYQVFPNPSPDIFHLQVPPQMHFPLNFSLWSHAGVKISNWKQSTTASPLKIDLRNLPEGAYILRIQDQQQLVSHQHLLLQ